MNDHTPDTVGVDISKAHLDVHRRSTGESARFANAAAGFEELAAWVGDSAALVVYESTGPWHREMEENLAGRLLLARVNALRARRFAQAMGEEAKTDAVDARTLAAMGAAVEVRRVEPRAPAQRDLDELVTARDALVKDRTAALNRQKHVRHRLLSRQLKNRLAQIGRQIKALDDEIAKVSGADAELSRRTEVLTSIAGVGRVVAASLIADMPELGHVDGKAAASLIGVAPWTRESGQWKGRSCIRGGRARPRRLLYMAAVAALQPGHGPQVRRTARPRQAAEGRPDGGHAQAGGAGQCAAEAGSAVDAGSAAGASLTRIAVPRAARRPRPSVRPGHQGAPAGRPQTPPRGCNAWTMPNHNETHHT